MRSPQHCQLLFVKFSSSSIKWSSTAQTTIPTVCSETLCTLVTSVRRIVFRTMEGSSDRTRNWIWMNHKYRRTTIKEKLWVATTLRTK
jgi:hypothetical protein